MLQVKIFEGPEAGDIENEINTWLSQHLDVDVQHVLQSESAVSDEDGDLCGNTTVTIFYRKHD